MSEGKTGQGHYLAKPPCQGLSRAVPLEIKWRFLMAKDRKNYLYLKNKKCQKVNPKNYRLICPTLMVSGGVIKHAFSQCELGLTHLIV